MFIGDDIYEKLSFCEYNANLIESDWERNNQEAWSNEIFAT